MLEEETIEDMGKKAERARRSDGFVSQAQRKTESERDTEIQNNSSIADESLYMLKPIAFSIENTGKIVEKPEPIVEDPVPEVTEPPLLVSN